MLLKRGMGNWEWENELENWKWEIISAVIIDEHDFCNVPRQNKRNIINWKIVYSTLQTVNFRKNNSFPFNNFPLHFPIFLFACSPFSFPYSLFPASFPNFPICLFPILLSLFSISRFISQFSYLPVPHSPFLILYSPLTIFQSSLASPQSPF